MHEKVCKRSRVIREICSRTDRHTHTDVLITILRHRCCGRSNKKQQPNLFQPWYIVGSLRYLCVIYLPATTSEVSDKGALHKVQCESKKQYTWLSTITSANVDWFTKFFYCQISEDFYTYIIKILHLTLNMFLHYLVKLENWNCCWSQWQWMLLELRIHLAIY